MLTFPAPGHVSLAGELDVRALREAAEALARAPLTGPVTLDLDDLELPDGPACAAAVDVVRTLVARGLPVTVSRAPHALAHVLYRVAMLPAVTLSEPREELPTSS